MSDNHYPIPTVGLLLGGKAYTMSLQYPGDVYYPKGPWYDIPELVVNLDERQVLRYRSDIPRPTWKVSASEMRKFRQALDITKFRDNRKELTRLKNGGKPRK